MPIAMLHRYKAIIPAIPVMKYLLCTERRPEKHDDEK